VVMLRFLVMQYFNSVSVFKWFETDGLIS